MTYKPNGLKPWERVSGINIGSRCAIMGASSPIPTPENNEFRCITLLDFELPGVQFGYCVMCRHIELNGHD